MNSLPPNIQEQLNNRCSCLSKSLADCDCEPAPNPELTEVAESLKAAISSLQDGYLVTEKKLDKSLHLAVIAAMNACQDVLDLLEV